MMSRKLSAKRCAAVIMILLTVFLSSPGFAAVKYKVKSEKLRIYAKKSNTSKVLTSVKKGKTIKVKSVGKKWVTVLINGKTGYALRKNVRKAAVSKNVAKKNNKITIKQVQEKLSTLGYLKSGNVTGSINEATKKAVRIFKALNGMKVNEKTNAATRKRIMATKKQKPEISNTSWTKSDVSKYFKKRGKASIVDLATGKRLKIRRVGGHNHLDAEPAKAKDTAVLKKVYGGTWSWDSRAIVLRARGHYYAAAMNGKPHGSQISRSNNFPGQFCIHLNGSTTHKSNSVNSLHQNNIAKAYEYLSEAA